MPFWSRSNRSNPQHPYGPDHPERSYSRQSQNNRGDGVPYSPDPHQTTFDDSVNYPPHPQQYHDQHQQQQLYHDYPPPQSGRPDLILPDEDYQQEGDYQPHVDEPKKHKRRLFGLGSSRENVTDHDHHSSKLSLGRKVSVSMRGRKHSPSGSQQEIHSPITHGPPQQGPGHADFQDYRNIPPPYHRQEQHQGLYSTENASYTSSRSEQEDIPQQRQPLPPQHDPRYAAYRQADPPEQTEGRPQSVWSSGADRQQRDQEQQQYPVEENSTERDPRPAIGVEGTHQRGNSSDLNKLSTGQQVVSRDPSLLQPRAPTASEPQSATSGVSPNPMSSGKPLQSGGEMGRQTPPPARTAADLSEQEINNLLKDYRELREKYSKVKRYYFDKEDQVKALQNTLAHQRLAAQRTSLDDGEYIARLQRLDGLISQLAFGFRKDWKQIPTWLQPYVNKDAIAIGKQEMTAVGRAFISRWLADELFDRYFHPGIDADLSRELKTIQRNVRSLCPPFQTSEEEEALNAKLNSWRLLTMDGLAPRLAPQDAAAKRDALIKLLNENLTKAITACLSDPPPADIRGGVNMIVELAVGILQHLPVESRDVHIEYFLPGAALAPEHMKLETGIPALTQPIAEDAGSDKEGEEGKEEKDEEGKKGERVRLCLSLGLMIRGRMVLVKAPVYT